MPSRLLFGSSALVRKSTRSGGAPPTPNALTDGLDLEPVLCCNVGDPSAIWQSSDSPVLCLLRDVNPGAVIGRVVLVNVNPLDGEIIGVPEGHRPRSERFKTGRPLAANGDASAAVVVPHSGSWIEAPGFHVGPYPEQPRSREAVGYAGIATTFFSEAPARLGLPDTQALAGGEARCATVAQASPAYMVSGFTAALSDDEASKALPLQIDEVVTPWHALMLSQRSEGYA